MARPEGFEPPAFGIGIRCDIQLRHGRIYLTLLKQTLITACLLQRSVYHFTPPTAFLQALKFTPPLFPQ